MKTKTCECGQAITFGVLEGSTRKVPVEFRTPVYKVVGEDTDGSPILKRVSGGNAEAMGENDPTLCVNHFRTCPKAGQFTRK